jgi:hypothetical protein
VRRAAIAALFILLLTSCQVDADVAVRATAAGTGRVQVTVTLDKEAAARAAGTTPHTDDLVKAGWKVETPKRLPDGGIVYRAEKRFRSPAEAARVVQEVGGVGGPLRGVALARRRSFLKTTTRLTGVVDMRAGAAVFGDKALTELLGGEPLGVESARVTPLDQALRVGVTAALPGRTTRVTARAGQRVAIDATAEQWNATSIAFAAVTVLALIAFAVSARRAARRRPR